VIDDPVRPGICRSCGIENPSHARFCLRCGSPLASTTSAATPPEAVRPAGAAPASPEQYRLAAPVYSSLPSAINSGPTALVLLAGIVAVVAVFLPWVTVSASSSAYDASQSASGTTVGGDGWWVLALGAAAALVQVIAYARGREAGTLQGVGEVIMGAVIAYVAFHDVANISSISTSLGGAFLAAMGVSVTAGAGLWIAAIAGIVVAVGGLWRLSFSRKKQG
jgi:hypothetical protein